MDVVAHTCRENPRLRGHAATAATTTLTNAAEGTPRSWSARDQEQRTIVAPDATVGALTMAESLVREEEELVDRAAGQRLADSKPLPGSNGHSAPKSSRGITVPIRPPRGLVRARRGLGVGARHSGAAFARRFGGAHRAVRVRMEGQLE